MLENHTQIFKVIQIDIFEIQQVLSRRFTKDKQNANKNIFYHTQSNQSCLKKNPTT